MERQGSATASSRLIFTEKAFSLEAAIRSAIADVKSAGYEVERAEIEAQAMPELV